MLLIYSWDETSAPATEIRARLIYTRVAKTSLFSQVMMNDVNHQLANAQPNENYPTSTESVN